jgi:hypothetical protein
MEAAAMKEDIELYLPKDQNVAHDLSSQLNSHDFPPHLWNMTRMN